MQSEEDKYVKLNGKRVRPAQQPKRYKGTCFVCHKRKMLIKEFGIGKDACIKCSKKAEAILKAIENKGATKR